VPLVLGSLFALVIVAFAIIGCYYTEQFDKEVRRESNADRGKDFDPHESRRRSPRPGD